MTERQPPAAGRPPGPTETVSCPLCGGLRSRTAAVKFGLRLARCRGCGLIFANPRLRRAEVEKRYDSPEFLAEYLKAHRATPAGYDRASLADRYRPYLDMIRGRLHPGAKLLDVGCGAGFFLKEAEAEGWAAEGTEISRSLAAYGREVVGVTVRLGTLEELNGPPGSRDIVTLFDVLEHVPEPQRTLEEVGRLLRPDGLVLISTPDYGSLSRLFLGKAWAVLSPAEHLSLFTEKTLRKLVEGSGLELLSITNTLAFNPDYTHRPGFRRALWKGLLGRLSRTGLAARLLAHESRAAAAVEQPAGAAGRQPTARRLLAALYAKIRKRLRGDILVALARNPDRPAPPGP